MTDTAPRRPLPAEGAPWPELQAQMDAYAGGDVAWREGKTAVYVFNAGVPGWPTP